MKERKKATKLCIRNNTLVTKSNKQNWWIYSNAEVKCSSNSKCGKTAIFTCLDTIFKWVYKNCYFGISLHLQEVFHVYLKKIEIAVSHLFLFIFSNTIFTLVNQISRNAQSPRKYLLTLFAWFNQSLKMRSQYLSV